MICIQLCYPSLLRKLGKIMSHWQTIRPGGLRQRCQYIHFTHLCLWNYSPCLACLPTDVTRNLQLILVQTNLCHQLTILNLSTGGYFCTAQHHSMWRFSAQLGPVWWQKQEVSTPKHHSQDKQCSDVPPAQLLCLHRTGKRFPCGIYQPYVKSSCL